MPIHDWTRVSAGTWHAFHLSWIAELQRALNQGILPEGYYAQAEQIIGPYGPDVLALERTKNDTPKQNGHPTPHGVESRLPLVGGVALATKPPRTRISLRADEIDYTMKQRIITIRHQSGERIIAMIELVSPGNRSSQEKWDALIGKTVECLRNGFHVLLIDLFPPSQRDPAGIHNAIWMRLGQTITSIPAEEPLTLVSYSSSLDADVKAFLEPTAVGRILVDMPLFLTPDDYVNVPLESTYRTAFEAVPSHLRAILDA